MSCYNSTVINTSADKVWARLRDFHDLSWTPNVVEKIETVGSNTGTQVGAQRVLNGAIHETLVSLDDEAKTFTYSIDDGPAALAKTNVQGYIGEVRVMPVTDTDATFVVWTASWSSGEGVADFVNPIYGALLGDLKKTMG